MGLKKLIEAKIFELQQLIIFSILMTIPHKLPIARMEDDHTHYLGSAPNGTLFWGYETFVFFRPYSEISQRENWQQYRREYVLLHTFDNAGNYLTTQHWSVGTSADSAHQSNQELERMIEKLGDVKFHDIEVCIFQIQIDNIVFGLVPDEDAGVINLQPGSMISFMEPWDGEYYT